MPKNGFSGARPRPNLAVRIASQPREFKAALRLVYQAYLRNGLIEPNRLAMRLTPYHLLPTTEVLVGVFCGQVACTLSLIRNGELGLPMESIFGAEVARRRAQGIALAEASCLADQRRSLRHSFPQIARLMRFIIQCAEYRGIDQLLIAVHPKHGRFYQQFLGFEQFAEEKAYQAVQNKPAIAMTLDIARLSVNNPTAYTRVFGVRFREEDLEYQPVSDQLREELGGMVDAMHLPEPCADVSSYLSQSERRCA